MNKQNDYRDKKILDMWYKRPPRKRTEDDIMPFHSEITNIAESLFYGIEYDSYQYLKGLLYSHIHGKLR